MQSPWDAVYLEQILQRRSVLMAFQPVVTLLDGSVIGHEALARPVGEPADGSVEWLFDAARRAGRSRDLDWLCWRSAIQGDSPGPQRLLFLNVSADILLDPDREVGQLLLLLTTTSWSPVD